MSLLVCVSQRRYVCACDRCVCVSVNVGMCVRVIGVCVCVSQRRYVCACDRCVCACACERGGGGRSAGRRRVGRRVGPAVGRREQPQKVRTPHNDVGNNRSIYQSIIHSFLQLINHYISANSYFFLFFEFSLSLYLSLFIYIYLLYISSYLIFLL